MATSQHNLPKQVIVQKSRTRSLTLKHPWIFSGSVAGTRGNPTDGDIVAVIDADGKLYGYGFFSPNSQIRVRVFEYNTDLYNNQTETYWQKKVVDAFNRRKFLFDSQTNCFRAIHAEADGFPGLIADVYNDVVVLQVLIKGFEKLLDSIVEGIKNTGYSRIYLKNKEKSKRFEDVGIENGYLLGGGDCIVEALENGLKYIVDFEGGQKTGFFLDQRDNRLLCKQLSANKTVLNTFAYSGGFSISALAGGASSVTSVDISAKAIELCDQNVAANFGDAKHEGITADCFDYLKTMPNNYFDLIVLDPPAFAKNASAVQQASRGYKEINLKAMNKIKENGLLFTFSCSQNIDRDLFTKIVFGAAIDAGRNVEILYQLTQPPDHPISLFHPEGAYLKGLVVRVY